VLVAALATGALDGLLPDWQQPLCEIDGSTTECGQARGVVVAVDGPSLGQVDTFSLRTPDGVMLTFSVERLELNGGGKPAPHLREHLLDGLPIVVDYRVDDGRHVALRYLDAP